MTDLIFPFLVALLVRDLIRMVVAAAWQPLAERWSTHLFPGAPGDKPRRIGERLYWFLERMRCMQ